MFKMNNIHTKCKDTLIILALYPIRELMYDDDEKVSCIMIYANEHKYEKDDDKASALYKNYKN